MTQGKVALIDDEDYEAVSSRRWYAHRQRRVHGPATFYALTNIRGADGTYRKVGLHAFLLPGCPEVDHENGNGLDCRRKNLRSATVSQNQANRRLRLPNPSSRYRGVTWHRRAGKWQAAIKVNGKFVYLGLHLDEESAGRAYDAAAASAFGAYARPNFGANAA